MKEYLDLCQYVLDHGELRSDRTGTGTVSTFGYQMHIDLLRGFPLLTTKKVHFRSIVEELLWFISGSTNIRPLAEKKVRIWNEWPYVRFQKSPVYQGESVEQFVELILNNDEFAAEYGELGPVYGKQWRDFGGVDQLTKLIEQIKTNPFSRRLIISAWNPAEVDDMALPPCHAFMQFYVSSDRQYLSCQLYQRSADVFLGVPFNIASYALLTEMIAHVCGLKAKRFIHTFGDVHIYHDHLEQVALQMSRDIRPLPTLKLNPDITSIFDFTSADIVLEGYDPHPLIKGKVSV